ncbi:MAG TPA: acyltransferase [Sphingomicrobium sp.]|nr:acyltransferase [Sphingomicrobium sp.]
MSFLDQEELAALGLASCGQNVKISRKASIYGPERIAIGDHVRIDDFCVISAGAGGINIGSHVHIAVYVSVIGAAAITLSDFVGLSSRVSVYSSNDDYSGSALTGPTIPDRFRKIDSRPVHIGRHVVVGSGSVVLPGVTIRDGAAVGALSLIREDCEPFGLYVGNPARRVRDRSRDLLELERQLAESPGDGPG